VTPPSVSYAKNGGDLDIEIHIGCVIAASFELNRWDNDTKMLIGTGVNNVASQTFSLKRPVDAYAGQIVGWDIVVEKMVNGDDQYLATVTIRQDGNDIFTHSWHDTFGAETKIDIFGGITLAAV
jgi:hypothetical protein